MVRSSHSSRRRVSKPVEPPANSANRVYFEKRVFIEKKMESYSDDIYEKFPFVCEPTLDGVELSNRLNRAVSKKFPSRHFGGCGYSCYVTKVEKTSPTDGWVYVKHYCGIGD